MSFSVSDTVSNAQADLEKLVSDLRGLLGRPELKLGGHLLAIAASPAGAHLPLPLAAPLDATLLQPGATLDFTLGMDLAGTERIGFVPLADDNITIPVIASRRRGENPNAIMRLTNTILAELVDNRLSGRYP